MSCWSWLVIALVLVHLFCACSAEADYSGDEESSDSKSTYQQSSKSVSQDSSESSQAEYSQKPEDQESGDYQEPDLIKEKVGSEEQSSVDSSGTQPDVDSESGPDLGSGSSSGDGASDQESGDNQEPDLELESGDGDEESESKSKSITKSTPKPIKIFKHPLAWIKHSRDDSTIHATAEEVQKLSAYVSSHSSRNCFISKGSGDRSYDGPVFSVNEHTNQKHTSYIPQTPESRKPVDDVKEYPGYATGKLDNGCAAFLVGPYHALTLAQCVVSNRHLLQLKDNINFLRGRDNQNYLQPMEWESVYVPQEYFHRGRLVNRGRSWALIIFKRDQPSPVWLPISYCSHQLFSFGDKVRAFGYHYFYYSRWYNHDSNGMSYIDCSIHGRLSCPNQSQFRGYYGGPVTIKSSSHFNDIKYMKTPPVVGINGRRNSCYGYQAISFNSEIFWSLAYLLRESGHNSFCEKWKTNKKDY